MAEDARGMKLEFGVPKFQIPKLRFFGQCHQTIRVWWSGGAP
jgi:hypothetical protein